MTLYTWSQTAASNSNADATINWAEGQPPSSVNDSSRAMMAAIAKERDDRSGNLVTGGSSTAITLTTNQGFTSLIDGISVTARVGTTNGAAPTLNVDALGAKAIHSSSGTVVPTGAMLAGAVHKFTYDSGDDVWYVQGHFAVTGVALTGLLIHEATELTTPATDDELPIYDASATANRRITLANIVSATALAATESAGGFVEMATSAEIRSAATGAKAIMAEDLETAAAAVALSDAATVAVDWDTGINFTLTLGGNRTLGNPTNGQPGTWRRIQVTQDGTGSRTLAYGNQYRFPGGIEPVLTTTASAVDVLNVYCRSASIFEVYANLDLKA